MKTRRIRQLYKKIALTLSAIAFVIWCFLGAGASLAWFADTSPEINNIFHFAEFDIEVSHRLTDGAWEEVDSQTKLFDESAKYEPGYVQVVYLKVKNSGTCAVRFHTAVSVTGYTPAINIFGQPFNLQDYLKFGMTVSDTETEMKNSVANREICSDVANMKLNHYATEKAVLEAGETVYIALVVRMPEDIDNVANAQEGTAAKVELGIIVKAEQMND